MIEVWRPCFDGAYLASNLGRVKRVAAHKQRSCDTKPRKSLGLPLKPRLRKDGYYEVSLLLSSGRKVRCVHRCVADAFFGPLPEGLVVNHKNLDKKDNRPENLEYVTQAQNNRHAKQNGRGGNPPILCGESNPGAKLTQANVNSIREMRGTKKQVEIAAQFGVSKSLIGAIHQGLIWRSHAHH